MACVETVEQVKKRLFIHGLYRPGQVFMLLGQRLFTGARRTEQIFQGPRVQASDHRRPVVPGIFNFFAVMTKV